MSTARRVTRAGGFTAPAAVLVFELETFEPSELSEILADVAEAVKAECLPAGVTLIDSVCLRGSLLTVVLR